MTVIWNSLKAFPAIPKQLAYSVSQAKQVAQSWLGNLARSIDQGSAPLLQLERKADESISSSDKAEYWFEGTKFSSTCFYLSEAIGLGGTWDLPEEAEHLGSTNPSTSTRTTSTLTLDGEPLYDDESSFAGVVLEGPAEPLEALLGGPHEPLLAVWAWGWGDRQNP